MEANHFIESLQCLHNDAETYKQQQQQEKARENIISSVYLNCNTSPAPRKELVNKRQKRKITKSSTRKAIVCERSEKQILRNERERSRKARLNTAFKILRNTLPLTHVATDSSQEIKYTQLHVLSLASAYISHLTSILENEPIMKQDDEQEPIIKQDQEL